MRVIVNSDAFNWYKVSIGIPQRSVLVLLSFIFYLHEIPDLVSSITQMFTDDVDTQYMRLFQL